MTQFYNSIRDVAKNYKSYDAWEQAQSDDVAKRKYLSKTLDLPNDKVNLTREKAKAVFNASDIMDKKSEDYCAEMEQATGMANLAALAPFMALPFFHLTYLQKKFGQEVAQKKWATIQFAYIAAPLLVSLGLTFWANAKQKESSRIGRFKAKQNDLKDPKNFVIYTPEQIKAAKEIAKGIPDIKEKKSMFAIFKEMNEHKEAYKAYVKTQPARDKEIQEILKKDYLPKQLKQGNEDKEIIVNIVKDVNMSAETYSENVENVFDAAGMLSLILALPIMAGVNKILSNIKSVSKHARTIASPLSSLVFALGIIFWGTKEKKEGSRIGRFKKRQEILDNPKLIMNYSDEQLNNAKHIKGKKVSKGMFAKLGDNFAFFGQYLKDKKEYKKYKDTTAKENQKIYEALKQVKFTDEQIKEAKNLQDKTFRSFDKIDEMSQRYSEDTEAATQAITQLINPICQIIGIGVPAAIAIAVVKGKFPLRGILKGISNMTLDKASSLRKFVNNVDALIKNDKELGKEFKKIIVSEEAKNKIITNKEITKYFRELLGENKEFLAKFAKAWSGKNAKAINDVIGEGIQQHCKKGPVAKWFRGIVVDVTSIIAKKKMKMKLVEGVAGKGVMEKMKAFYKEYKTLSKTIMYGGLVPIIAVTSGLPFAFASWMTNIQLKAGRIGIMKAMEEIDNPKLFVNENLSANEQEPQPQAKTELKSNNLLEQLVSKK